MHWVGSRGCSCATNNGMWYITCSMITVFVNIRSNIKLASVYWYSLPVQVYVMHSGEHNAPMPMCVCFTNNNTSMTFLCGNTLMLVFNYLHTTTEHTSTGNILPMYVPRPIKWKRRRYRMTQGLPSTLFWYDKIYHKDHKDYNDKTCCGLCSLTEKHIYRQHD